jgi:hypothetical protein
LHRQEICHECKKNLFRLRPIGHFGLCLHPGPSRRGKRRHWSWHPGLSSAPVLLSLPISRVCGTFAVLLPASAAILLSASAGVLPTSPGICAAGPRICTTQCGLYAAPDVRATGSAGAADIFSAPIAQSGNAACVSAARRAALHAPSARCESLPSADKRQSITKTFLTKLRVPLLACMQCCWNCRKPLLACRALTKGWSWRSYRPLTSFRWNL